MSSATVPPRGENPRRGLTPLRPIQGESVSGRFDRHADSAAPDGTGPALGGAKIADSPAAERYTAPMRSLSPGKDPGVETRWEDNGPGLMPLGLVPWHQGWFAAELGRGEAWPSVAATVRQSCHFGPGRVWLAQSRCGRGLRAWSADGSLESDRSALDPPAAPGGAGRWVAAVAAVDKP